MTEKDSVRWQRRGLVPAVSVQCLPPLLLFSLVYLKSLWLIFYASETRIAPRFGQRGRQRHTTILNI